MGAAEVELSIARVVDQVVQRGPVLHPVEQRCLGALRQDRIETDLGGTHREPQERDGVDDDVVAELGELRGGEQLALAELGHVREQRDVDRRAEGLELGRAEERLGEDRVGTCVDEGLGAVDRCVEPPDGAYVRAGHHEEVGVASTLDRRADPLDRGLLVDDLLAVQVTAALGVDLVLDVAAGHPGVLERLDGARDVHGFAEPGVGVDERREVGHARDLPGACGDLGRGRQADVGQAQVG
jgi:hypothetical protein